jgi:histone chaperone ASF1
MSCISITNVQILDNPTRFTNPLQFEISYECIRELKEDLEWKVVYVGSSESEEHDQELDSVLLGPVKQGVYKFVFQVEPPDVGKIPKSDLLGVTVILLTCSYKNREFVRVGYYVNNEDPEAPPPPELFDENGEPMPAQPQPVGDIDINKIQRNILADKPRITQFPIPWDDDTPLSQQEKGDFNNSSNSNSNSDAFMESMPMET